MSADAEAVRAHIVGGGQYDKTVTEGFNLSTGEEVVGLQIRTRGRMKPLARWRKEFTLYASGDQTVSDLHRIFDNWLASPTPEAPDA